MAIQYFATKEEAESVPNSQLSWCIVKDGKHWCAVTGEDITLPPAPPTVLDSRRFWTTAYDLGYLPAINAMLATLPERDQIIAQRETSFDRTSHLFAGFAQALGVSNAEVLAFFAYGAALP